MGKAGRSTKFSMRLIRWAVREILRRGGASTTFEIKGEMAAKYRNCPTSNQLSQLLSRSGYFIKLDTVNRSGAVSNKSVALWGIDDEKCAELDWYQSEVDAVEVWNEVKNNPNFGGFSGGGWDAPRRLGQGRRKPKIPKPSDTEKENNSVE